MFGGMRGWRCLVVLCVYMCGIMSNTALSHTGLMRNDCDVTGRMWLFLCNYIPYLVLEVPVRVLWSVHLFSIPLMILSHRNHSQSQPSCPAGSTNRNNNHLNIGNYLGQSIRSSYMTSPLQRKSPPKEVLNRPSTTFWKSYGQKNC